jgi:hypothetical protein
MLGSYWIALCETENSTSVCAFLLSLTGWDVIKTPENKRIAGMQAYSLDLSKTSVDL